MFKQSLANLLDQIRQARFGPVPSTGIPSYRGDPVVLKDEREKVHASVHQYASETHAARAMKRYQRWVKNNPNRNLLEDMPTHIHEKRVLLASVMK